MMDDVYWRMKPPVYTRPLTDAERDAVKAGLRSSNAFTLRRSQVMLGSARDETPPAIARQLGCASQTVQNSIRAFNVRLSAALQEGFHRNLRSHTTLDDATLTQLHTLALRSPRDFGHETSL